MFYGGVLVCLLFTSIGANCQTSLYARKINLSNTTGSVISLLQDVNNHNGVIIEYSSSFIQDRQNIHLAQAELSLGELLDVLLTGQKIFARIKNEKIILTPSLYPMEKGALLEHFQLSGYVQEESSGEPLPFAIVKETGSANICQANAYGYYTLPLSKGEHALTILYAGYPSKHIVVNIRESSKLNLTMQPDSLPEVKLTTTNMLAKDGGTQMEKYLAGAYVNMLGENDPVRSMYLMPGNVEAQETTGKLLVRGGDPDQSIFILDGSKVFNPTHLLGEISIINETSLKSIRQFKSDFPGRYDGALSSITEVSTKDGNMSKWRGEASVNLLSGAFTIEGPLVKGHTAIMASLRHSYGTPLINCIEDDYRLDFSDVHLKLTQRINEKHKILLSGYWGKDRLSLNQYNYQNLQRWGNQLLNINWNYTIGHKSFLNTSIGVSQYNNMAGMLFSIDDDSLGVVRRSNAFNNWASINQVELRTQAEIAATPKFQFKFGGRIMSATIHPFNTTISKEFREELDYYTSMKPLTFKEVGVFYENEVKLNRRLFIRPGVYFTNYFFKNYSYNSLLPRFYLSYQFSRNNQLSFSYAQMNQFLHQVSTPFLGINNEFWVPSSTKLQPAQGSQINIGYRKKIDPGFRFSLEGYYKVMNNVTNFAEGGNIFFDEQTWEDDIVSGKGWSYGAELLLLKRDKKWSAQLSYALSWNWRQFADFNDGQKYPFKYDRRHMLNIALLYKPLDWLELNLVWYFNTGDLIVMPVSTQGGFNNPNVNNPTYDPTTHGPFIFSLQRTDMKRTPAYHRLNLNATFQLKLHHSTNVSHKFCVGVYNAYSANNKYLPNVWTTQNDIDNTTLSRSRLFDLTWYFTYAIRFR